jgi:small-conductance mechanosensitive channel
MAPLARLVIWIAGIAIIVPVLVEPTFEDIVALVATVGLALAFALKDYVICLIAGIVTIVENTYQPGDWIEFDGTYGEVKAIGTRAVHIVTADDNEVIVPHSRLWSTSVSNASSGGRSLLCVTNFYLHPDHDAAAVRQALTEIGEASTHRKPDSPVKIIATDAVGHALQDQGLRQRQP